MSIDHFRTAPLYGQMLKEPVHVTAHRETRSLSLLTGSSLSLLQFSIIAAASQDQPLPYLGLGILFI